MVDQTKISSWIANALDLGYDIKKIANKRKTELIDLFDFSSNGGVTGLSISTKLHILIIREPSYCNCDVSQNCYIACHNVLLDEYAIFMTHADNVINYFNEIHYKMSKFNTELPEMNYEYDDIDEYDEK